MSTKHYCDRCGADVARVEQLRPVAQKLANTLRKPLQLVVFENRVEKETICPEGSQPS